MRPQFLLSILLAICLASTALADEWKTLSNCTANSIASSNEHHHHIASNPG